MNEWMNEWMEHWWNDTDRKTKVLVGKPVPVQICPLHIPHRLACDWTWAFVLRGQWVSVCFMAQPCTWPIFAWHERTIYIQILYLYRRWWFEFSQSLISMLYECEKDSEMLVRFEVLTAVLVTIQVLKDVMLCYWRSIAWQFTVVVFQFKGHAVFFADCLERLTESVKALQLFEEFWITYPITQCHILRRLKSAE